MKKTIDAELLIKEIINLTEIEKNDVPSGSSCRDQFVAGESYMAGRVIGTIKKMKSFEIDNFDVFREEVKHKLMGLCLKELHGLLRKNARNKDYSDGFLDGLSYFEELREFLNYQLHLLEEEKK